MVLLVMDRDDNSSAYIKVNSGAYTNFIYYHGKKS